MMTFCKLLCCGIVLLCLADQTTGQILEEARMAFKNGKTKEALALANKAVTQDPKSPEAYLLRSQIHESLGNYREAVADCSKVIELEPNTGAAYDRRGSAYFCLGEIDKSLADFDRYLELQPERKPHHWKRGISLYYLGKYEAGAKQFESYQTVDDSDVENAVWRCMCMARAAGVPKAQAAMLKVGDDPRVPMKEIYALFRGKGKPEDVLAAAKGGKATGEKRRLQLFYAHLYLGLWYDVARNDRAKALDHMEQAVKNRVPGYMWEVARVHRDLLKKTKK